jgi:hypothetical protein
LFKELDYEDLKRMKNGPLHTYIYDDDDDDDDDGSLEAKPKQQENICNRHMNRRMHVTSN